MTEWIEYGQVSQDSLNNMKIKSFILHYNPKFSKSSIILSSYKKGNEDIGESLKYTEKDGEIRGDYEWWGWNKGYYTHEGHQLNNVFKELPKDKWTRVTEFSSVKFGKDANVTDIVYE